MKQEVRVFRGQSVRFVPAVILVLLLATSACQPSPPSPPVTGATIGQLAERGTTVFSSRCASCHGGEGQGVTGPPLIGTNASLEKFKTAQGLLDFIRVAMPFNAPGSLSPEEYAQVLSFLLLQNKFVPAETALEEKKLDSLPLKK